MYHLRIILETQELPIKKKSFSIRSLLADSSVIESTRTFAARLRRVFNSHLRSIWNSGNSTLHVTTVQNPHEPRRGSRKQIFAGTIPVTVSP